MKKLILFISLMLFGAAMFAQTTITPMAVGSKGVDSLYGATTVYYYPSATALSNKTSQAKPFQNTYVYSIQASTTRSAAPTGSDSCHIFIQVSIDNVNWFKLTGTTPQVSGGAVYLIGNALVTTTTNGSCLYQVSTYYPYVRVCYQHYVATTTMYPTAKLLQKLY